MAEYTPLLSKVRTLQQFARNTLQSVRDELTMGKPPTQPISSSVSVPREESSLLTTSKRSTRRKSGEGKIPYPTEAQLSVLPGRWARLYEALWKLSTYPMSAPFLFPIHEMYTPESLVGYDNVIQHPMDLRTVLGRILHRRYTSEDQVYTDLCLIASNCELFNGSSHPLVTTNVKPFREEVDAIWKGLYPGAMLPRAASRSLLSRSHSRELAPEYVVLRERVKARIEKLQEREPEGMEELLDVINREAPQAMAPDEDGDIVLNLEELTDPVRLQKIDSYLAVKLESSAEAKRQKR